MHLSTQDAELEHCLKRLSDRISCRFTGELGARVLAGKIQLAIFARLPSLHTVGVTCLLGAQCSLSHRCYRDFSAPELSNIRLCSLWHRPMFEQCFPRSFWLLLLSATLPHSYFCGWKQDSMSLPPLKAQDQEGLRGPLHPWHNSQNGMEKWSETHQMHVSTFTLYIWLHLRRLAFRLPVSLASKNAIA